MFIDGINAELQLNGLPLALHNLELLSKDRYGWTTYTLKLEKELKVSHHIQRDIIRISGSLPYFYKGHNLISDIEDTRAAIQLISELIELDISSSIVRYFEFGTVVTRKETPSSIFAKHLSLDDFFIRTYENGKYFVDPRLVLKLYDAKESFKRKARKWIKDKLKDSGVYDPRLTYVKAEAKYKKPELHFKRQLTLKDLKDPDFIEEVKTDLKYQYSRIKVTGEVLIPTNKSLTTVNHLLCCLNKEYEVLTGIPTEKRMKDLLNNIDPTNLSRQNKHTRMRTFNSIKKEVDGFEKRTFSLL